MARRFVLRREPKKPVRKTKIKETLYFSHFDPTLGSLIKTLRESPYGKDVPLDEVELKTDCNYLEHFLSFQRAETDEELEARMEKYRERKQSYDEWFKKNKKKIKEELKRKREEERKREQKKIAQAEKELEEARAKVKALRDKLSSSQEQKE